MILARGFSVQDTEKVFFPSVSCLPSGRRIQGEELQDRDVGKQAGEDNFILTGRMKDGANY